MNKTNAARHLDRLRIPYQLREYDVDESDLSAERVADKVNLPLGQVFKTLVVHGDKAGVFLACIPERRVRLSAPRQRTSTATKDRNHFGKDVRAFTFAPPYALWL